MSTETVVSQINFNTLVVKSTTKGETTVDVVPGPTTVVPNVIATHPLLVNGPILPVGTGNPSTVPLVVKPSSGGQTLVDNVPGPISLVPKNVPSDVLSINIGQIGPQGPQGPPGTGGGGPTNVFIQSGAPVSPPSTYAWFQTLLGNSGHDITLWIEDGV